MLPAALALSLALQATPGWDPEEPVYDEGSERHFELTAWGGSSLDIRPGGAMAPWAGAELGWRFTQSVVSLLVEGHRYDRSRADRAWTPVVLARVEQRFETMRLEKGRGLEGTFAFGLGAGRPTRSWEAWFQIALGLRLELGPLVLRGELGFERQSDFRLGAGAGLAF